MIELSKENIRSFFTSHQKGLLFTSIISMLYVLPIILANVYYIDDMGRIEEGYGLIGPGRFVSTFIMKVIISLNTSFAFNLFPFSILFSAVLYGISGYLLSLLMETEKGKSFKLSSLILVTSPYLLENLSYRYDSITMSLSVILIILPYFLKGNKIKFFVVSVIAIYTSFGLYQVGAMCYLIIGVYFLIDYVLKNDLKKCINFGLIFSASFITALILYKISLGLLHVEITSQGQLVPFEKESLDILNHNLNGFLNILRTLGESNNYYFTFAFFVLMSLIGLSGYIFSDKSSVTTKIITTVLVLTLVCIAFLLIGGISIVVKGPNWFPRVMIGFPFLLFILVKFQSNLTGILKRAAQLSVLLLLYFSFLLSAQYGTVLKNQDDFSNFTINLLAPHLTKYEEIDVIFDGIIPTAHQNKLILKQFPIMEPLAIRYERGTWIWGLRRVNKFGMTSGKYRIGDIKYDKCTMPVIDSNKYYTLRIKDNLALVDFTRSKCN
jgi:hypothetical protein